MTGECFPSAKAAMRGQKGHSSPRIYRHYMAVVGRVARSLEHTLNDVVDGGERETGNGDTRGCREYARGAEPRAYNVDTVVGKKYM